MFYIYMYKLPFATIIVQSYAKILKEENKSGKNILSGFI